VIHAPFVDNNDRMSNRDKIIVLFDVDGTLTLPRQKIKQEMLDVLRELRKRVSVGVVGGSNLPKIKEQLGETATEEYDYLFAENGVVCFHNGKQNEKVYSMKEFLTEVKYKQFADYLLNLMKTAETPFKTDEFVEERLGMINVSPIGRKCTQTQRDDFFLWDNQHKIREKLVKELESKFQGWNLKFSIGSQISIDIFPVGWDKTFCLQYLKHFSKIYFFGDKTEPGGNDYEIYTSSAVHSKHSVKSPDDTVKLLRDIFLSSN